MTGVFTVNYPATMAVIDRMTKLVEKLTRINERYESEISTLSRCRGTTENPHNHDSQIAAYRKIISNNSKDIVDLGLLISQIFSLIVNTRMTDFFLTQLIKNMMSGDSNAPNPETSVLDEDLTRQAAKAAGIGVTATGSPRIMSATDYQNYQAALTYLKSLEPLKAQAKEYEAKGQYAAANALNQHIGSLSSKNTQEIKRHVGVMNNDSKTIQVINTGEFPDTSGNYGVNAAGITVTQTNKHPSEWYRDTDIILPFTVSACGKTNEAGTGSFYFDYEIQEYLQSTCENVINSAKNNKNVSNLAIAKLEELLTPELIMAIGCTESGWLEEYVGGIPTGVGTNETWTGIIGDNSGKQSAVANCNGSIGASVDISDYYGIKESTSATATLVGNNIIEMVDGGWTTNHVSGDYTSDADLLYKALYNYGYGSYVKYGFNGEHALSAAYKLYMYDSIIQQRGGYKNLCIETYDNGLTNIDSLISFTYGLAGTSTDFTTIKYNGIKVHRDVTITGSDTNTKVLSN